MNGLTLNLIGVTLFLLQISVHFYVFIKENVLFTMHPTEAARINKIAMWTALSIFVVSCGVYMVTS